MFHGLRPYADVRNTNLPWAATLPSHWSLQRAKSLMHAVDVRSESGAEELLTVSSHRGVVPRSSASVSMFQAASYAGHKLCWPDDLVINSLWAWGRGLGVSRHHGVVSTAYGVYRTRNDGRLSPAYLHHLVRSTPFQWELQVRSYGVWKSRLQITDGRWLDTPLLLPPRAEQAAIVKYLAHANTRIDAAISARRRLVALLKQARKALIDEVLTGSGAVRTVPSSSPWLPAVPSGWEWRRCRTLVSLVTSGSRGWAKYYADTGPMFLQSGNLGRELDLRLDTVQRVELPESLEGLRTRVEARDILVCITGALTGNVALVPDDWSEEAYVNQHVALVRPRHSIVFAPFLAHALAGATSRSQFKGSEYGGTKQGLGLDEVKNVEILLPPHEEQVAIVGRIRERTAEFDRLTVRAHREIDLLNEFRTRLVADVVTGQVDVREIAARLPDVDPTAAGHEPDAAEPVDLDEVDEALAASEV